MGELDEALHDVQQAVAIREKVLPPEHSDLLCSRENLASVKQAIKERNENSG